jgi:hypothetical protein
MERDRELASIRRQHEREIYMLKRRLHENAKKNSSQDTGSSSGFSAESEMGYGNLNVSIPVYILSGIGSSCHAEYQVNIRTIDSQWTVMRRFRQFRDLHMSLTTIYGPLVTSLPFPSRRLFGNRSDQVSGERQRQLNAYLNVLLLTLVKVESCPIFKNPTKNAVLRLSAFFHDDAKEATADEVESS